MPRQKCKRESCSSSYNAAFKAAHTILEWMASKVVWPLCKVVTVQVISQPFLWLSISSTQSLVLILTVSTACAGQSTLWYRYFRYFKNMHTHLHTHKYTWTDTQKPHRKYKKSKTAQLFPGHLPRRWKIEEFLLIWTKISIKHSVRDWVICALMQPTEYLQWCSARISCVRGLVKLHYCCFI